MERNVFVGENSIIYDVSFFVFKNFGDSGELILRRFDGSIAAASK